MYRWDNQDFTAFESISQRMGLYQSEGLSLRLTLERLSFDLGISMLPIAVR